ncbi:hypothetical protein [Rhodococcus sp. Chr-9]|uniref:hypothetical protein n=1 Tax=Rhodococcus sp. Chr-9 TaxID=713612 RepID=UPI000ABAAB57|nr:hypothetical protein [Rhodococcus sp. Chr-9]
MTDERLKALAKMREPFADHQINVLPKPYSKDAPKEFCRLCNSRHGMPAAHLDYVGHAALTDRLLEVDPEWSWEPFALDASGLPLFDRNGGLWIRLTVCGVMRIGYGDMGGKNGANAVKEAIGDALRNAGMRFGAALDLWHKGDLHDAEAARNDGPPPPSVDIDELLNEIALVKSEDELRALWTKHEAGLGDRYADVSAAVKTRRAELSQSTA